MKQAYIELAAYYTALSAMWAKLALPEADVYVYANARLSAHNGYLAIGRGKGNRRKFIRGFDATSSN